MFNNLYMIKSKFTLKNLQNWCNDNWKKHSCLSKMIKAGLLIGKSLLNSELMKNKPLHTY